MEAVPKIDLETEAGRQAFQAWIVSLIRKEINSYTRQVIAMSNTGEPNRRVVP
jgi:hypothetical protein